ncbi:MAG: sensor histidine kinase [Pseudobdellovibrionaceae bacterium]
MQSIQDLQNQLFFNKLRFQILAFAFTFVYFPFGYLCIYVFNLKEDMIYRGVVGLLGVLIFCRVTFFKKINYAFIESLIPIIFPFLFVGMVYFGSMNHYHFIYITGCYTVTGACAIYISRTWHYVLSSVIMLISVPVFGYIYQVPTLTYVGVIFQLIAFLSLNIFMIMQRLGSANQLVSTMEKLGESERARLQSAKMASMGEMAGGIAHEINNPMSIITGKAGMILRWAEKNQLDPEKVKTSAQKIVEIVDRIGKITKGLLIFARNGENDPFRSCDLSVTIDNTVEMLREKAKGSHIEIEWQKPTSTMVDCRETQIAQTVINLLNNSVDALKRLEIEDKKIQVQLVVEETWCKLSVVDSGSGIAAPVVEKMFQPFFSTKEVGDGTGMGLSNSEGIARQHKGTLVYDNETGHTRFILKIPAKQEGALGLNEAEAIDPESAAFSGRPGGGAAA